MPYPIQVKTPDAVLVYEFDWADEVPAGASLLSVTHVVPSPAAMVANTFDAQAKTSTVAVGSGVHGGLYVISAEATLSTGETVPAQFTLRVIAPATFAD